MFLFQMKTADLPAHCWLLHSPNRAMNLKGFYILLPLLSFILARSCALAVFTFIPDLSFTKTY